MTYVVMRVITNCYINGYLASAQKQSVYNRLMYSSSINLVHFPAVIKLHADDELIVITTKSDLENNPDLSHMHIRPQDILIDKHGHIFKLHNTGQLTLTATSEIMPLASVIHLIQLHLSNHGTCCVSKFSAHSIEEAFNGL